MAHRPFTYTLWKNGGIKIGELLATSDSRALLDYAAREGLEGELRGTYTFVISPTEKLYVVREG